MRPNKIPHNFCSSFSKQMLSVIPKLQNIIMEKVFQLFWKMLSWNGGFLRLQKSDKYKWSFRNWKNVLEISKKYEKNNRTCFFRILKSFNTSGFQFLHSLSKTKILLVIFKIRVNQKCFFCCALHTSVPLWQRRVTNTLIGSVFQIWADIPL